MDNLQLFVRQWIPDNDKRSDITKLLLDYGADPNAKSISKSMTALMVASTKNDKKLINLLLTNGALIDLQDSLGYTALFYGIGTKNLLSVETLLKLGADVSIDAYDKTSTLTAAENCHNNKIYKAIQDAYSEMTSDPFDKVIKTNWRADYLKAKKKYHLSPAPKDANEGSNVYFDWRNNRYEFDPSLRQLVRITISLSNENLKRCLEILTDRCGSAKRTHDYYVEKEVMTVTWNCSSNKTRYYLEAREYQNMFIGERTYLTIEDAE